jgi:hypothetical protein
MNTPFLYKQNSQGLILLLSISKTVRAEYSFSVSKTVRAKYSSSQGITSQGQGCIVSRAYSFSLSKQSGLTIVLSQGKTVRAEYSFSLSKK